MTKIAFKTLLQKKDDTFYVSYDTFVHFLSQDLLPFRVELKENLSPQSKELKSRLLTLSHDSKAYLDMIQLNKDLLMFEISMEEILKAISPSGVFKITIEHA